MRRWKEGMWPSGVDIVDCIVVPVPYKILSVNQGQRLHE